MFLPAEECSCTGLKMENILDKLQIEGGATAGDRWTGLIDGEKVSWFEYERDSSGRTWLLHAKTADALHGKGIGRRMIAAAVAEYGEVWASSASPTEGGGLDARHLSDEGAALVEACIREGIMRREWLRHPYLELDEDDGDS